jgi:hypothetical protein
MYSGDLRPPFMALLATLGCSTTRTAAFIAFLRGAALAEILATTARASRRVVAPRDPRGG